ncbi:hypothetical protein I4U23_011901 [Adineta vaga]|nr:hypothetical protein I4U23_011901 [Adineta vaga]
MLNVSIFKIDNGISEMLSTVTQLHIIGEDFHNRMITYFVNEFRIKNNIDLSKNIHALRRLHKACERVKHILSTSFDAYIEIHSIHDEIDFYSKITRTQFEELNEDLFSSMIEPIEQVLNDTKHIPKNEIVIYGATIETAVIFGYRSEQLDEILTIDITTSTVYTETSDGIRTPVIKRNTAVPNRSGQTNIEIKFFQGEQTKAQDNHYLGRFKIPIFPRLDGISIFDISFCILTKTELDKIEVVAKDVENHKREDKLRRDQIRTLVAIESIDLVLLRS